VNRLQTELTLWDSEGDSAVFTARPRNVELDEDNDELYELNIEIPLRDTGVTLYLSENDLNELVDLINVAVGY
jgi:hypothetical protein